MLRNAFRHNRKILVVCGISSLAILFLVSPNIVLGTNIFEIPFTSDAVTYAVGTNFDNKFAFINWNPGTNATVLSFLATFRIGKVGNPQDNFLISFYRYTSNPDSGTQLGYVEIMGKDIPSTPVSNLGGNLSQPFLLSNASTSIVLSRSGAIDTSNYYIIITASTRFQGTSYFCVYNLGAWQSCGTAGADKRLSGIFYDSAVIIPISGSSTAMYVPGLQNTFPFAYFYDFKEIISTLIATTTATFPILTLNFGSLMGSMTVFSSSSITYFLGSSNVTLFRNLMAASLWILFGYAVYKKTKKLPEKTS